MDSKSKAPNLYLVVLGGRTKESNIELHDVRWVVGYSIEETIPTLKSEWFGKSKGLHIDSYIAIKYVDGYEINKELVSSIRYRANIIVYFNKNLVRKLLQQRKIRFAETRSNDVLVVPVFDDGDGATLWFEPGDWRTAWLARPANEGLVPLILPLGDVMDMAAIEVAEALAPSHKALLALAERYGTREVVVSSAVLNIPGPALENDLDVDGAKQRCRDDVWFSVIATNTKHSLGIFDLSVG